MTSIEENPQVILPIMFSYLYRIKKVQWNWAILALVHNVLKVFMEVKSSVYDGLTATYKSDHQHEEKERKGAW